jgi:hypothetical protein
MKWIVWSDDKQVPESVFAEISRIIDCVLGDGSA